MQGLVGTLSLEVPAGYGEGETVFLVEIFPGYGIFVRKGVGYNGSTRPGGASFFRFFRRMKKRKICEKNSCIFRKDVLL